MCHMNLKVLFINRILTNLPKQKLTLIKLNNLNKKLVILAQYKKKMNILNKFHIFEMIKVVNFTLGKVIWVLPKKVFLV